jgi:hypothetical protein
LSGGLQGVMRLSAQIVNHLRGRFACGKRVCLTGPQMKAVGVSALPRGSANRSSQVMDG